MVRDHPVESGNQAPLSPPQALAELSYAACCERWYRLLGLDATILSRIILFEKIASDNEKRFRLRMERAIIPIRHRVTTNGDPGTLLRGIAIATRRLPGREIADAIQRMFSQLA